MWIYFPNAFLSIVAHRSKPRHLLVRARFRGDIERIFPRAKVIETPGADYAFRAEVTRNAVGQALDYHAASMEYDNVKDAVPKAERLRHDAMMDCWRSMLWAQQDAEQAAY